MLSKVITLAQIAIDTGKALSSGIASASSLPYPANLAAIATTVGTVLANIATAITTVNSAKFAKGGSPNGTGGGVVDGPGGKNDKDLLTVRVNKDELILNENQQKRLHKELTGKGGAWSKEAQKELFGIAEGKVAPAPDYLPVTSAFGEIGSGAPVNFREVNDTVAAESGMVDQMAETIENLPNPVVSVEDINEGQRRVEIIENIDTL